MPVRERKVPRTSNVKEGFRNIKEGLAKKIEEVKEEAQKIKRPLPKKEETPIQERNLFGSGQSKPEPKIVKAKFGDNAGLIGAALLPKSAERSTLRVNNLSQ